MQQLKFDGGYILELEDDMKTIKRKQQLLFPKKGKKAFAGHEFFEASSIRKYNEKYYFIYSSKQNHELCYAISDYPSKGFQFAGTLVSNGDLFLNGNDENYAVNYIGNNHGSLLFLNGKYYIFYHRHTNQSSYSRQMCAEEIEMDENGMFRQAEMSSCGLNGQPLKGIGEYSARIACNLWSKQGTGRYDCKNPRKKFKQHPYFTQDKKDGDTGARQYIANMRDGSVAGFKYFNMGEAQSIRVELKGKFSGEILVSEKKDFSMINAKIRVENKTGLRKSFQGKIEIKKGKKPLYFQYCGEGKVDFLKFELL